MQQTMHHLGVLGVRYSGTITWRVRDNAPYQGMCSEVGRITCPPKPCAKAGSLFLRPPGNRQHGALRKTRPTPSAFATIAYLA